MALRDKLAERAAPYLEPGEQIRAVFLGQSGPSPYWVLVSYWIVILTAGYATIAVTDRAVLVLRNGRLSGTQPKSLTGRFPLVPLGEASGLWGEVHIGGVRYWVNRRFHKDVQAANAAITGIPAAS
jgi:hypothetical protein